MLNTDNNYTYLIKLEKWKNSKAKLPILLGVDENGEIIVEDLAECKNLKIVGANDDIKNGFSPQKSTISKIVSYTVFFTETANIF